jgi:hypothetical protein
MGIHMMLSPGRAVALKKRERSGKKVRLHNGPFSPRCEQPSEYT